MAGQTGYRFVYIQKHIGELLTAMKENPKPPKIGFSFIRDKWLLRDARFSAVIHLLIEMEFVDKDRVPTERYNAFLDDAQSKKAIAAGLKCAYPTFFEHFERPYTQSKEVLAPWIQQQTGVDSYTAKSIAETFLTFCSLADFD